MKNKFLVLCAVSVLVFALTGCGSGDSNSAEIVPTAKGQPGGGGLPGGKKIPGRPAGGGAAGAGAGTTAPASN